MPEELRLKTLASSTVSGAFWIYFSHYLGKVLAFVTLTILAWLLTKDDFGLAGYAFVFMSFLEVLNNMGLSSALIYYEEDELSSQTVFWLSVGISIILMIFTWLAAPFVALFFGDDRLVNLVRVLGITIPLAAVCTVHTGLLQKNLAFNRKFIPDFSQSISKGLVSILLALLGFGVWSLVLGQLGGRLVSTVVYWIIYPWTPKLMFSWQRAKNLLGYGGGMVAISLLGVFLLNVDYLMVGYYLGTATFGVYTLAFRIPELTIKQFSSTLAKVLFPVYSKLRSAPEKMRKAFLETLHYVSLITIPLGVGLALVAKPFVLFVYGEKWAEAIPVIQAISVQSIFVALAFNAGDVLKASGRLKTLTILSLIRGAMLIPALWFVIQKYQDIVAVGWTQVVVALFSSLLTLIVVARIVNSSLWQILYQFRSAALAGAGMALGVSLFYASAWVTNFHFLIQLLAGVVLGGTLYIGVIWLLEKNLVLGSIQHIKGLVKRKTA